MQIPFPPPLPTLFAGLIFAVAAPSQVTAQEPSGTDVRKLPEIIKARENQRLQEQALRKSEKLKETLTDIDSEGAALQAAMTKAANADEGNAELLKDFMLQKVRTEQIVEYYSLQITAAKAKAEGLKALRDAQEKSLEALVKRAEASRQHLETVLLEADTLKRGELPTGADENAKQAFTKAQADLTAAKALSKKLEGEETALAQAADALTKTADTKLGLADEAQIKATRKAQALGLDGHSEKPDEGKKQSEQANP